VVKYPTLRANCPIFNLCVVCISDMDIYMDIVSKYKLKKEDIAYAISSICPYSLKAYMSMSTLTLTLCVDLTRQYGSLQPLFRS
jgi:hypothetical protein